MGQSRKIPWDEIRLKYVTNPSLSLRGLAQEYGIDYRNLKRRSKRDDWQAARAKSQAKLAQAAEEQAREQIAKTATRNLLRSIEDAHRLRRRAFERLEERFADDAAPEVAEETQVATKTTAGMVARRETKKRTVAVDIKAVTVLLRAETDLLKLALLAPSNDDRFIREIRIE